MKTFTSPIYFLITMTLVASGLIENPAYGATKSKVGQFKTAGRATTSGASNTILSGVAAPKTTLGINGDFYIDTKALTLYGPKVGGKWPTPFSLRGATGGPGIAGANGADARVVTNASSVAGPPGPIGARGEVGAKGATGATGDSGATGAAGSSGSQGSIGATGPAGVAGAQGSIGATGGAGVAGSNGTNGTQGAKGDTGNTGAKGDVGNTGIKGDAGVKGDTGTTGPSGSSTVYKIAIPVWTFSTSTAKGGLSSATFGTLAVNSSYRISIVLYGYYVNPDAYFAAELSTTSADIIPTYTTSVSWGKNYISSSLFKGYTFVIDGTVTVGSTPVSLSVFVMDVGGITGGEGAITLSGNAIVQQVGSVTETS